MNGALVQTKTKHNDLAERRQCVKAITPAGCTIWTLSSKWESCVRPLWKIRLVQRLADGLVLINFTHMTDQTSIDCMWAKSKSRKLHDCAATGVDIASGTEVYRPVGNVNFRSMRVLASVIDEAINELKI